MKSITSLEEYLLKYPEKNIFYKNWEVIKWTNTQNIVLKHLCGLEKKTCTQNFRGVCPVCNRTMSYGEFVIYNLLKNNNINFEREFSFPKSKYRFDFYFPDSNLIIEYDGEQHFKQIDFFKKSKNNDKKKERLAIKNNCNIVRISYKNNTPKKIYKELKQTFPFLKFNFDQTFYYNPMEQELIEIAKRYKYKTFSELNVTRNSGKHSYITRLFFEQNHQTKEDFVRECQKKQALLLFPAYEKNLHIEPSNNKSILKILHKMFLDKYKKTRNEEIIYREKWKTIDNLLNNELDFNSLTTNEKYVLANFYKKETNKNLRDEIEYKYKTYKNGTVPKYLEQFVEEYKTKTLNEITSDIKTQKKIQRYFSLKYKMSKKDYIKKLNQEKEKEIIYFYLNHSKSETEKFFNKKISSGLLNKMSIRIIGCTKSEFLKSKINNLPS
jgi:very-short-patch-repair endonuclease